MRKKKRFFSFLNLLQKVIQINQFNQYISQLYQFVLLTDQLQKYLRFRSNYKYYFLCKFCVCKAVLYQKMNYYTYQVNVRQLKCMLQ